MGIEATFLTAFGLCACLVIASMPGGFLYGVRKWLDSMVRRGLLPKYVAKPLLLCETCMAWPWGAAVFFLAYPWSAWSALLVVPFILLLAVVNFSFWTCMSMLGNASKFFNIIVQEDADTEPDQEQHS